MARLKFLGFDLQGNGVPCSVNSNNDYVACDSGVEFVSPTSDSVFYPSQDGGFPVRTGRGKNVASGAGLGKSGYSNQGLSSNGASPSACFSATLLKSSIGNINDVYCTFDTFFEAPGNTFFNRSVPSTWAQTSSRWQIFKFGDLSVRLISVEPAAAIPAPPGYYDVTFGAYNGATSLFTITVSSAYLLAGKWFHFRIRAKLASGTDGLITLYVEGSSNSSTGINTVATTPFASVDRLWFSGGGMQEPDPTPESFACVIDNILIDNSAFPIGKPITAVVSSGFFDNSVLNWAASSGGTLSAAALSVDSNRAVGSNVGARLALDITAPTMTTWLSGLIGYQIVPGLLMNRTVGSGRRVKSGVSVGGTDVFANNIRNQVLPETPTRLQNCGTDTLFYQSGSTSFQKADVSSTDAVIQVL